MTTFGVHAGLQNTTIPDLVDLWRRIEEMGFGWISVWDHFYAADGTGDPYCHEAVATHAALACNTERVRCGSLVYCAAYRHPAVLAKAIATIDHFSNGRTDVGIGAGWSQVEFDAYGMPFRPVKERMDMLEEALACLRGLLRNDVTNFEGKYFTLTDAKLEPKPVQSALPIWVGGGGEKRTLKLAAKYADGWNVPFVAPDSFAHKREVLAEHCSSVGRDPGEIRTTINVGLAWREEDLKPQFGAISEFVRPGVLMGSEQQVIERVQQYVDAGADQINIAMRAPWDRDGLERLASALNLA